ncbi:MAG: MFS transporter [Planctomycetota bacterium]
MFGKDGRVSVTTASLLLLVAINLFNYIDRQVLAAVEPEIRRELDEGRRTAGLPALSEAESRSSMGLLSTAFLVTYMLLAPVFGWLADRYSRWKLVGIGVILWSLASGASGWNWQMGPVAAYWALFATRCFVGVGEGGYGPVAPAMLSDLYPVAQRGRIMSFFYLAIPVGGALGYAFGEIVMQRYGWRWAFFLVVPPGLLLGALCFFMPDPPRGQMEDVQEGTRRGIHKYLGLFEIPSYVLNTLGMTAMTFSIGALAFWMPDFLERQGVEGFGGIGPRTIFGAITAFAGLLATLSGGIIGDRLRPWHSGAYFLVSGGAMFLGFPMILGFLYTTFPYAWIYVFGAVFCLFFNTGPTNTILANVTHPAVRASGFALNILIIHLFGDAISPPLIGYLMGSYGDEVGFFVIAFVVLMGGLFWVWGSAYLERDTRLAGTRG